MLDFEKLTPSNGAVTDLKELIFLTLFNNEGLEKLFTTKIGVRKGDKLGFVGDMEDIGEDEGGCDPQYKAAQISASQKEWSLGDWTIALKECYKDLEETIAGYCLKKGTEIADLTGTEYMDYIVAPKLERAIMNMMWRIVWFGDKDAKNITNGGVLTAKVKPSLFTMTDGLFKHFFALGVTNPTQRTTIAANTEVTYALQMSKIRENGVATSIFDSIIYNANSLLSTEDGVAIFATKSMCDALSIDIKEKHNVIMPWEVVFDGIKVSKYNGVTVYEVSVWDNFIKKYEDDGSKLNMPHRAIYGSPKNIFVGTPNTKMLSDLDIFFDKKDRNNYIYSTGKIGTLLGDDTMFHLAY